MRLAEFKMRLLVFFAAALRKWAGSVEPTIDERTRPKTPVENDAVLPAESYDEAGAASGPPEHWARRVATAPPEHWLELIRQKAPHLLSPTDNEAVSKEASAEAALSEAWESYATGADQEADDSSSTPAEVVKRKEQQSLQRRSVTKTQGAKVSGRNWLNRLRFQPSRRRAANSETAHAQDETARSSGQHASITDGRGIAGDKSGSSLRSGSDRTSEQTRDRRPAQKGTYRISPRRSSTDGDEGHEVNDRRRQDRQGAYEGDSRGASAQTTNERISRDNSGQQIRQLPAPLEGREAHYVSVPTPSDPTAKIASNTFVGHHKPKPAAARSQTSSPADENQQSERATTLIKFDESRTVNIARTGEQARSSSSVPHWPNADAPVAGLNLPSNRTAQANAPSDEPRHEIRRVISPGGRGAKPALAAREHTAPQRRRVEDFVNGSMNSPIDNAGDDERANNRFAPLDLATPALFESSESVWPTLPPATGFEISDEFAAMEREAETLRRLDQEQRGTLWNA